ncbi:CoA transferase [Arthrobacter bambusae]|nr:CoA transferase [Arthrobacter bambusae]
MEIGAYISLPTTTSLLTSLGAEVVKIERPFAGEDFRRHQNDQSPYFRQYNSGKRSLAVDLKSPEGVALVKSLVPRFDVVLENMRPGKLKAMGLGVEACRQLRPDIIYGSMTGFGETGPLANRPAYDTIGHAFGGLYSVWGDEGNPRLAGGLSADLITGIVGVAGVLAAIIARLRTGEGQRVETSIMEAISTLTADSIAQTFELGKSPTRTSRHPQAQNFCVPTSDGKFIALHLSSSQKFWRAMCRAIGRADLAEDSRFAEYRDREANYFDLAPIVEKQFATQPFAHWERELINEDVPFGPVLSIAEYIENEQVTHLGMFDHQPDGLPLLRAPWQFNGERPKRSPRTPKVGSDTRAVAGEVLSSEEVEALIFAGVLSADDSESAPDRPTQIDNEE